MHFIYLALSLITPFLLGLFLIIGIKYNISKELKFCTTEITKVQSTHKKLTKKLLSTNKYATKLRKAYKAAKKAARIDPTRISLAVLLSVKASQKVLHTYQKGLLLTARLQYQKLQTKMFKNGYLPSGGLGDLAVTPYPLYSASPNYRLKTSYKLKKQIKFTKLVDSKKNFHFLIQNIKGINQFFKLNCGATILQKGGVPSDIKLLLDR